MENFSKSPVGPYTRCTGQIWYVHRFPPGKVCVGPNSRAVHPWEVSELEFKNMSHMYCMGNSYTSYREFFKVTCGTVHEVSGMYIDSHLERCVLVQTAELYTPGKYLNWNLKFITCGPILARENFSKSPVGPYLAMS